MEGVEVQERLRGEVRRGLEDREKVGRGGKLKSWGVKKNGNRRGRGGRRVLGKLGNISECDKRLDKDSH